MSRPARVCHRVVGWQPRHDDVGVATLSDRGILPQDLPIFDELESLFIRTHFMSGFVFEKPAACGGTFISAHRYNKYFNAVYPMFDAV